MSSYYLKRQASVKNLDWNISISRVHGINLKCTCLSKPIQPENGPVIEVMVARHIVGILFQNGVALAVDRETHEKLCYLKDSSKFIVRTIYFNKRNNTLIVVYHSRFVNHGLSISIYDCKKLLKRKAVEIPDAFEIQNLVIPYPGFVEFEEMSGCIITSTPHNASFTFWDMQSYKAIFTASNLEYKEIRISQGIVAFFKQPEKNILKARLCNLKTGKLLITNSIKISPNKALQLLELCGGNLIFKQESSCVRIHNMLTNQEKLIHGSHKFYPKAINFFSESENAFNYRETTITFLAINSFAIDIITCSGDKFHSILKIPVFLPENPVNNVQMVQNEGLIIVYSQKLNDLNLRIKKDPNNTEIIEDVNNVKDISSKLDCLLNNQKLRLNSRQFEKPDVEKGLYLVNFLDIEKSFFFPINCDSSIYDLKYDTYRKEIYAGGSAGLHCIRSTFYMLQTSDG